MNTFSARPNKDVLSPAQRWLEILVIPAMLLLLGFLVYHQVANTGFFTAKFGPLEMLCLYGPIVFAGVAPAVRALTGHRNPARPFEAVTSLFLAVGSLWLLLVFPFNFTHLADALPGPIHFVLAWVPDGLGKILLIFQIIIGPFSALLTVLKFLSLRVHQFVTPA